MVGAVGTRVARVNDMPQSSPTRSDRRHRYDVPRRATSTCSRAAEPPSRRAAERGSRGGPPSRHPARARREALMAERLDTPKESRRTLLPKVQVDQDAFGKIAEGIARFMGTPRFLAYMTVFVVVWLGWNSIGPFSLRFDSRAFGFTLLTLMLSLQASYSAPLILLAQNRQVDRD